MTTMALGLVAKHLFYPTNRDGVFLQSEHVNSLTPPLFHPCLVPCGQPETCCKGLDGGILTKKRGFWLCSQ